MDVITTRELKERLDSLQGQEVTLLGWIRNHRKQKNMGFMDFFDGTCFKNPQVVYDNTLPDFETVQALRVGSAVKVTGKVVPSYKDPETPEIQASSITLEGDCPEDYPTTLPKGSTADASEDFFGKPTSLAVTGQLEGETFAMAFSKIYTFGPTFRAENSNTKTHAAEVWLIEPEVAFCDLNQLMDLEEDFLKNVVKTVLEKCPDELKFLDQFSGGGLLDKLNTLLTSTCARVTHEEAITILRKAMENGTEFKFEPKYGEDTAKEHEKYLTEEYFHSPVFVYNWPKDIKAFYMYQNDDGKTVSAVDLLVPGAGELMGGSQREDRLEKLTQRMDELGISKEDMYWYVNLRKFGGCTHAGFGMGFERLIIYLTGVDNIRDVIPYFRTPQNCDF